MSTTLPPMLAARQATAEKRSNTPTNQPVRNAHVHPHFRDFVNGLAPMTEAEALASDLAISRWKDADGPARENEARAMRLQMADQSGRFQ